VSVLNELHKRQEANRMLQYVHHTVVRAYLRLMILYDAMLYSIQFISLVPLLKIMYRF
jgi:hypothetical protein